MADIDRQFEDVLDALIVIHGLVSLGLTEPHLSPNQRQLLEKIKDKALETSRRVQEQLKSGTC